MDHQHFRNVATLQENAREIELELREEIDVNAAKTRKSVQKDRIRYTDPLG